eukprot:scaffold1142_cov387-Prasinococcus_capsulatus_cf.AAC.7
MLDPNLEGLTCHDSFSMAAASSPPQIRRAPLVRLCSNSSKGMHRKAASTGCSDGQTVPSPIAACGIAATIAKTGAFSEYAVHSAAAVFRKPGPGTTRNACGLPATDAHLWPRRRRSSRTRYAQKRCASKPALYRRSTCCEGRPEGHVSAALFVSGLQGVYVRLLVIELVKERIVLHAGKTE